jgi:hypothetical protein
MSPPPRPPIRRILAAGILVAFFDIAYVWIYYVAMLKVIGTERLFQSIAAGLLGRAAFEGGWRTALLGGALHVTIGCIWATAYWTLGRLWQGLAVLTSDRAGKIIVGFAYGAVIWLTMDLVVLPLSHARPTPIWSWSFLRDLVEHVLILGPSVTLVIRHERG